MSLIQNLQYLAPHKSLLTQSKIGLEKEGLRVAENGEIANTAHPKNLGSALCHPYITTDFSEALLELITPPSSIDESLEFLGQTQRFVYQQLEHNELLWNQSMPCVIRGKTAIPLANYGSSNLGTMKTVYRRGLGCRYGRTMQVIAGIHFNYSYSADFWQTYQNILGDSQPIQAFIDYQYMGLSRNLLRFGWLVSYLFGASPAVCKTFLRDYHKHSLQPLSEKTLYEPFATSLRMGDIGYQNSQEDRLGVKASYHSLSSYIHSLKDAMQTPCPEYAKFSTKINDKHQQLNSNILQIENEYYTSVRPKRTLLAQENPLNALKNRGIEYIELRSLDINPLMPLGVDKEQLLFLESLMLFCLLESSPAICSNTQVAIDSNNNLVGHQGRDPNLKLILDNNEISIRQWGLDLCEKIKLCANLLGDDHAQAVSNIGQRFIQPEKTPSAQIIDRLKTQDISFFELSKTLSSNHQQTLGQTKIKPEFEKMLLKSAQKSHQNQHDLEQDNQPFEQYLQQYLQRYL